MKTHPHALASGAERIALESGPIYPDDHEDQDFRDFVESISLTQEELVVFLARPELSIAEVRHLFARRQDFAAYGPHSRLGVLNCR